MKLRSTALALAGVLLIAGSAAAQSTQTKKRSQTRKSHGHHHHGHDHAGHDHEVNLGHYNAPERREAHGESLPTKTYKQRINTIARTPMRHDIEYLKTRDREHWNGHHQWRGIRDQRPMVARKTTGFKDRRPHRTRRERVLLVGRGPIQGPPPAQ
ncbi:MAG: hypothetical protein AAF533_07865 [Acidobacteriota bacterium]